MILYGRISYNKDILFKVTNLIKTRAGKEYAILKGITVRIVANAPVEDLESAHQSEINTSLKKLDEKLDNNIKICINGNCKEKFKKKSSFFRSSNKVINGKVLHLDGDRTYAERSLRYYKKLGINAVVKNVAENKQPQYIAALITRYKPDILVITRT